LGFLFLFFCPLLSNGGGREEQRGGKGSGVELSKGLELTTASKGLGKGFAVGLAFCQPRAHWSCFFIFIFIFLWQPRTHSRGWSKGLELTTASKGLSKGLEQQRARGGQQGLALLFAAFGPPRTHWARFFADRNITIGTQKLESRAHLRPAASKGLSKGLALLFATSHPLVVLFCRPQSGRRLFTTTSFAPTNLSHKHA
jgi:hypothetical protein